MGRGLPLVQTAADLLHHHAGSVHHSSGFHRSHRLLSSPVVRKQRPKHHRHHKFRKKEMPEILLKPPVDACWRFDIQQHPVSNPCCQRQWDEVSHWSRQQLTFFIIMLDLFITLLASIGATDFVPGFSGEEAPDFQDIFSSPEGAGIALLIFLVVPIVMFVVEELYTQIIAQAEKPTNSAGVRYVLYFFFWFSIVAIFLGLLALLLGLGITGQQSTIQVAAVIWGVRLFVNWVIWKPIVLTLIYVVRKYLGKDRPDGEDKPKKCPQILCCSSSE
eukprot:TRINITY_DN3279_c0_g1_i1.p1 TRINITY_DN3279_c0_g1~~TRINITY_DN3279_c0_g1_i1.p1  ORF type:complete len:274 (-),score=86.25 TRINITY_DN3279_c0_g1_i1:108-929(-)